MHIAEHLDNDAQHWLERGLGYPKDEKCPFCAQSVRGLPLIGAYRTYFSQEYHELRRRIAAAIEQLDASLGPSQQHRLELELTANAGLMDFWHGILDKPPSFDASPVSQVIARVYREVSDLLRAKARSPLGAAHK